MERLCLVPAHCQVTQAPQGEYVSPVLILPFPANPPPPLTSCLLTSPNPSRSTRREPLGRAYERGFKLPEGLGTDRAFGLPVNAVALDKEGQVREVMQSGPGKDDGATRELYRRTHGHYAPGEQRVRGYDWGGQDPNAVVFGRPPQAHDDTEIARVLAHEAGRGAAVVPAVLADFKATRADELGRVRTQGYGDRACVAEPAGIASTRFEEMGVEALLKHQAGSAGLEPDADLGRSLRPGFRNMTRAGDEDRSFGVPSVRVDLPAPRGTLSMANATNFGNEPDAASLVFPSAGVDRGIGDEVRRWCQWPCSHPPRMQSRHAVSSPHVSRYFRAWCSEPSQPGCAGGVVAAGAFETMDVSSVVQVMSRATSLDEVRDIVASAGVEADDDILEEAFQIAVAETGRCTLVGFLKAKAQVERVRAGL